MGYFTQPDMCGGLHHHHHDCCGELRQMLNQYYSTLLAKLQSHTDNSIIHVTAEEKSAWNNKADKTDLDKLKEQLEKLEDNVDGDNSSDGSSTLVKLIKEIAKSAIDEELDLRGYATKEWVLSQIADSNGNINLSNYVTKDYLTQYLKDNNYNSFDPSLYYTKTQVDNLVKNLNAGGDCSDCVKHAELNEILADYVTKGMIGTLTINGKSWNPLDGDANWTIEGGKTDGDTKTKVWYATVNPDTVEVDPDGETLSFTVTRWWVYSGESTKYDEESKTITHTFSANTTGVRKTNQTITEYWGTPSYTITWSQDSAELEPDPIKTYTVTYVAGDGITLDGIAPYTDTVNEGDTSYWEFNVMAEYKDAEVSGYDDAYIQGTYVYVPNVTKDITVTLSATKIQPEPEPDPDKTYYTITYVVGDGITMLSSSSAVVSVEEGGSSSCVVSLASGYENLTIDNNLFTISTSEGSSYTDRYIISIDNVTSDQTVTITATKSAEPDPDPVTYTITYQSGAGVVIDAGSPYTETVISGASSQCRFHLEDGYENPSVSVNATGIKADTEDGYYIAYIDSVISSETVTITANKKVDPEESLYKVTWTPAEVGLATIVGPNGQTNNGSSYTEYVNEGGTSQCIIKFKYEVTSVQVLGDSGRNDDVVIVDNGNGTYTLSISNVTSRLIFTLAGVIKKYTVTWISDNPSGLLLAETSNASSGSGRLETQVGSGGTAKAFAYVEPGVSVYTDNSSVSITDLTTDITAPVYRLGIDNVTSDLTITVYLAGKTIYYLVEVIDKTNNVGAVVITNEEMSVAAGGTAECSIYTAVGYKPTCDIGTITSVTDTTISDNTRAYLWSYSNVQSDLAVTIGVETTNDTGTKTEVDKYITIDSTVKNVTAGQFRYEWNISSDEPAPMDMVFGYTLSTDYDALNGDLQLNEGEMMSSEEVGGGDICEESQSVVNSADIGFSGVNPFTIETDTEIQKWHVIVNNTHID